ncbi:MAG: DUF1156 domain-containing protein [Calditrichaeota bacterium]|nr:MAG: DUF1156 domain-containing protein [Calditrichota bacterium]
MEDKRFIEESFPVKEVSKESAREKNIRHGHISTLHIWWARRPLASSRATNYAALIPAPKNIEEWQKERDFIIELSKWENSNNEKLLERARKKILEANGGVPPKVLDPFGGGGAIPLEALRLGCETYSNDLNPVAVLIQKCTLEYPQKYGKPIPKKQYLAERPWLNEEKGQTKKEKRLFDDDETETVNPLVEDVKYWGNWVLEEAKKEIGQFYPEEPDGSVPVGYIWARTIPCQNPACVAEIPLMRQYWLAKKAKKKVALYPYFENNEVQFKIVGDGAVLCKAEEYEKWPSGFKPENGTVARAVATCPVCGSTVEATNTRRLFKDGKSGQRMVAVVTHKPGTTGKKYRISTENDFQIFKEAETYLHEKREKLFLEWGMDPVPDEEISVTPSDTMGGTNRVLNYDIKSWGDLFNGRQKLALAIFVEKVRNGFQLMLKTNNNSEYSKALVTYLGLALDMQSGFNSRLSRWENTSQIIKHVYSRQALPMMWDYAESNAFSGSTGSWENGFNYYLNSIIHCSGIPASCNVYNYSATQLAFKDNFFDVVLTDPPYYDNVPYSYLSDLFYVWLKRSLGMVYPELFSTPLTPKKNEIVAYTKKEGGKAEANRFFEDMLKNAFMEIQRILKPKGLTTIVYAHKSTDGWETLINSLLDSGLVISGAWPLNTEMQNRILANETASLASSIYIVARKMERQPTGFYNQVKDELDKYLNFKLERLWQEGISGSDFFIAAIGSAIEVFGKYEQVMDYEGNVVRANRLLQDVRKIVTDFAVKQILHNGFAGEISDLTRFYVLWRWEFGAVKVRFDDARKLAQSCSIDLALEWNRSGFITKDKEFIRVLGPQERKLESIKHPTGLVDVLHKVLLLWEKSKRQEIIQLLQDSGFGNSEAFYRVGQAVSECLTNDNKEKKLLDGFLSGRERLMDDVKKGPDQTELF